MKQDLSPISSYTDEELLNLWNQATKIDYAMHDCLDYINGYGYGESLLNQHAMRMLRAGLMAHTKLCREHNIPVPENLHYEIEGGGYGEVDECGYADGIYEYESSGNLVFDRFSTLHEIGDFEEEIIVNLQEVIDGDGCVGGLPLTKGMLEGLSEAKEMDEDGMYELLDVLFISSKKLGHVMSFLKEMELLHKEVVPKEIEEFFKEFTFRVTMKNFFWVQDFCEDSLISDRWCALTISGCHAEEGIVISPLYRYLSVRIGAYIAQELADRVLSKYVYNADAA